MIVRLAIVLSLAGLFTPLAAAQSEESEATGNTAAVSPTESQVAARVDGDAELSAVVGMRASITQVFFPGSELQPLDGGGTADRDFAIRFDAVYPHGDGFRYDLTWTGFRPGQFNLSRYLQRKDGTAVDALPKLMVTVTSVLPPDRLTLSPGVSVRGVWVGGYRSLLSLLAVLWVLGLGLILWTQRGQRRTATAALVDPATERLQQLRQLLTEAAAGRLDAAGRTALESHILAFFRELRGLPDLPPQQLLITLQSDPVAGPLLQQLERWLYDRPGSVEAAVERLLVPLRDLADRAGNGVIP
jgi:hypothetical protein